MIMIKFLVFILEWLSICLRKGLKQRWYLFSTEDSFGCFVKDEIDSIDASISDSGVGVGREMEVDFE